MQTTNYIYFADFEYYKRLSTYKIKISNRKDFKVSTNINKIKIYTMDQKTKQIIHNTGYSLYINDTLKKESFEEKGPVLNYNSVYHAEAHANDKQRHYKK